MESKIGGKGLWQDVLMVVATTGKTRGKSILVVTSLQTTRFRLLVKKMIGRTNPPFSLDVSRLNKE